ncbi:MAG TPA: hypothetical protein VOA87_14490 [Thermoanaerobaculia bacterium]|nr:hypothetical protein [Thermoanaerobaculia bacterium]
MLAGLGWSLQLLALVIVGTALLIGLFYGAPRTELAVAAFGAGLFLVGRWLSGRSG